MKPDKPVKRLKQLKLSRVDLVEAGANPEAHIKLIKAVKRVEDGKEFPASDYAYVPDSEKPSTWKLRLTSEPGGEPDARIVGAAVAALGEGFRGQKVEIPAEKLPGVKAKVLAAWKKVHADDGEEVPSILEKSERGTVSMDMVKDIQAELEAAKAEVEKVAKEKAAEQEAIRKDLDEARAELEQIRKEQRSREFVEKAQKFSPLGEAEELGRLLEAADSHFEDAEKETLSRLLKSATEQVEKGSLFKRLSQDTPEPQSWEAKLSEAARDRVAKGESPTVEQAKIEIMREDKEIRAEYAKSRRVK